MTLLRIGQIARQTGVTVETVRFYEKQGLIGTPERTQSGYRQYRPETIKRVLFIQHAKEVGFTLKDIGELLDLRQSPDSSCADIKLRATRKIEEVDQKIRDLQRIRNALEGMIQKCTGQGALSECPIIEDLEMNE